MVRCCAKDHCGHPALDVDPLKHSCAQCKLGVHALCIAYEMGNVAPPYDTVCLECSPPSNLNSTTGEAPVNSSTTSSSLSTVRYQQILGKKYVIPLVDGKHFLPVCEEFRYLDEPHPSVKELVISPFSIVGQNKQTPIWLFYSTKDKNLESNFGLASGKNQCCNLCGISPSMGKDHSTTPLKRHLEVHHTAIYFSISQKTWRENLAPPAKHAAAGSLKKHLVPRLTVDAARKIIVEASTRFIINKNLPFNTTEDPEFRRLIRKTAEVGSMLSSFNIGREAVAHAVQEMTGTVHDVLGTSLQGQAPHLCKDHWTSRSKINFEGRGTQYVTNECVLIQRDLSCDEFTGSSSGDLIFIKSMHNIQSEWGIEPTPNEKVYALSSKSPPGLGTIVTDTAASMNKFGMLLEEKSAGGHVYCTDHVIQLTAQKAYSHPFLKSPDELGTNPVHEANLLTKLRNLVGLFNSTQKSAILLAKQKTIRFYEGKIPVLMKQDVVTRWWSTYDMCERALYLKHALMEMEANSDLRASDDPVNKPSRCPTSSEWEALEQLSLLLKPFKATQQALEANQYVTSSLVLFLVACLEEHLSTFCLSLDDSSEGEEDDPSTVEVLRESIVDCASLMLDDLRARWGDVSRPWPDNGVVQRGRLKRQVGIHPNLLIASAVDPRFKDMGKVDNDHRIAIRKHVLGEVIKAAKQKLKITSTENVVDLTQSTGEPLQKKSRVTSNRNRASRGFHGGNIFATYARSYQSTEQNDAVVHDDDHLLEECKLEIQRFYATPSIPICKPNEEDGFVDPLPWWKKNKELFPNVWMVARYHLGIPATSANAERCFSFTNRLISSHRCGMTSTNTSNVFLINRNIDCLPQTPTKNSTSTSKKNTTS
jgi:hypothetical protein